MTAIAFGNVSLIYGQGATACAAINDLSLQIILGDFIALVGASGSGKTTLLNLAAGLCVPTTGKVELLGSDLAAMKESQRVKLRRSSVGFVFQNLDLLPTMTAWQNVELPLVVNGSGPKERSERVKYLLELSGLSAKKDAYPDTFSNGQRQQLAILRAVAHRPRLMLMDEPTSSLDSARANILLDLVTELNKSEGTTIVMTTHDPAVASRAKKMLHLHDGKLVEA